MSVYEIDAPPISAVGGLWARISGRLGRWMRRAQYARMVHVLSTLSDDHLRLAGIERSDIRAHARKCIYGS